MSELTKESVNFGKYKGFNLSTVLKDRKYCLWLLEQEWFKTQYEYLYNQVKNYKPLEAFLKPCENKGVFVYDYKFFNLVPPEETKLEEKDLVCYKFYFMVLQALKNKIDLTKENPYDIKAPTSWLKQFESETGLNREIFKEFINSNELPNITSIVEDIKKAGNIEYKGAKSFLIAKEKSLCQEKFWEDILKAKYGDGVDSQYKLEKCFFDFIRIDSKLLYECKLGLKDFNEEQYKKYMLTLDKEYFLIYLIDRDCVVNMKENTIYTTNVEKYKAVLSLVENKLCKTILEYKIVQVDKIENGL